MNDEELQLALDYLGTTLPYGMVPGYGKGGKKMDLSTKAKWDLYLWNPPQGMKLGTPMLAPDPNADPKPTWEELEKAATKASDYELRKGVLTTLAQQAQKLISRMSYASKTTMDEVLLRLGNDTTKQDAHAYKMRRRYHYIKNWVKTTTDKAKLSEFNPAAPANYSDLDQIWTTPEGNPATLAEEDQEAYGDLETD